jgi:hypothetical protein
MLGTEQPSLPIQINQKVSTRVQLNETLGELIIQGLKFSVERGGIMGHGHGEAVRG